MLYSCAVINMVVHLYHMRRASIGIYSRIYWLPVVTCAVINMVVHDDGCTTCADLA
jgi:hypothetical protein